MAVRDLIIPFIKSADDAAAQKHTGQTYRTASGKEHNTLVDFQKPAEMIEKLKLSMPGEGQGKEGLLETIDKVLKYSVNTWDQGFLDKLFASNTPVGVISDLVLSVLNTNVSSGPINSSCRNHHLLTACSSTSTRSHQP
jgi:glutamate decarboxylase